MMHIYYDTWYYQEDYIREHDPEGEPMYDYMDIAVDQAHCGEQDYHGNLLFAADPECAECEACIDAYALYLLSELP